MNKMLLPIVILLLTLIILSGCSTAVPVSAKFPDVPEKILEKCPQLEKLENEAKLSDIAKTVTINYTTYYECAVKHDAFVEWYKIQKDIFDKAGK